MSLLSNIITYVRRLIKVESTQVVSDTTIIDYINRFYNLDMPARLQLFELKSTYEFETQENISRYQFPYADYQMVEPPLYIDGVTGQYYQSREGFFRAFPEQLTSQDIQSGDGGVAYSFSLVASLSSGLALLRGFKNYEGTTQEQLLPGVYITAIDAGGNNLVVTDDGLGNLTGDGTGTINYTTTAISVTFNSAIPSTSTIRSQYYLSNKGTPRFVLFYDNYFTIRPIPNRPFLIKMDAYVTPATFLNSSESLTWSYMDDYIARGAARRILSDLGDWEQFTAYEGLFKEQEAQVLRRTNRQQSTQRAGTIFASQTDMTYFNNFQN